jgi:NitT/TauT family transport system permease protein
MNSHALTFLGKTVFVPLWNLIDVSMSKFRMTKSYNTSKKPERLISRIVSMSILYLLLALFVFVAFAIVADMKQIPISAWKVIAIGASVTLLRTISALAISTLWTVPAGVAIGLSPKWSKRVQPFVQMAASVPATALFPALLLIFLTFPSGLNIAAIVLMLLGTQWYVLFNVIAGAMAIPNDLREATAIYQISGWNRWRYLILPSIFPYLVTGMITATGGAWNASIVSEYVAFAGKVHETVGLGATIASAANNSNFHLLLASTVTMAILVSCINRFFWQRIYHLAESKYHFE